MPPCVSNLFSGARNAAAVTVKRWPVLASVYEFWKDAKQNKPVVHFAKTPSGFEAHYRFQKPNILRYYGASPDAGGRFIDTCFRD